jgi:HAD superfamily hydrolase (TIGR01450 family)
VTSSLVAADILSKTIPEGKKVFVIGGDGVITAIKEKGFVVLPLGKAQEASAVVMGVDPDINFSKMSEAALLVGKGIPFISTNPDKTFPTPRGLIPGTGAWVNVIITATGVQPVIAGKPSPYLFEMALDRLGTKKNETMIVGDRIETDIAGGQAGGFPCGLVLSGISTMEEAERWKPKIDFIAKDLHELIL